MRIVYFDESGDDGFPQYSSPLFVLSAIYMQYLKWKENLSHLVELRAELRRRYGLPMKLEMHARQFLLNKNPYRELGIPDVDRVAIIGEFCDAFASLDWRIVNVCIDKPKINTKKYQVLEWALKLSVQRIENDIRSAGEPNSRFIIITDPGRVGKMRKTTRKMQRFNYIPSKLRPGSYRREVERLIEDPLPKDSKESYFIQAADLVAQVVYLYSLLQRGVGKFHGRMPTQVNARQVEDWMTRLRPCLNEKAAPQEPYGIKFHPAE